MGRGYQVFPRSQAYRDNYDRIFRKKSMVCPRCGEKAMIHHTSVGEELGYCPRCFKQFDLTEAGNVVL